MSETFCRTAPSLSWLFFFRSFDPTDSGEISEERFRKIMKNKEGVSDEDINEMIDGRNFIMKIKESNFIRSEYRAMSKSTIGAENVILYKGKSIKSKKSFKVSFQNSLRCYSSEGIARRCGKSERNPVVISLSRRLPFYIFRISVYLCVRPALPTNNMNNKIITIESLHYHKHQYLQLRYLLKKSW